MSVSRILPARNIVDVDGLIRIADRAEATLAQLRQDLIKPQPTKSAPMISGSRLAQLCGMERTQLNHLCSKGIIKPGQTKGNGRKRMFTLAEARDIVQQVGKFKPRPMGVLGMVLACGNFKGGVGKTTVTVAVAQGLSLLGYSVCLVDLDPQASSTTLMGWVPDAEVLEDMTVMPVVYGDETDLMYAAKPSYWDGIDLIPSSPDLFGADYYLPNKQAGDPSFRFWEVLDVALPKLREKYDVIIIDTPPTLSYLALASFMASDGMIIPLPPETLDYASSTQFFRQFSELFKSMRDGKSVEKKFEFIKILLSKVKSSVSMTDAVKSWIKQTYPEILGTAEVPDTDLVKNAYAEFKTIYDLESYDGSQRTYDRALEAFDAVVAEIEVEVQNCWAHREQELAK
ncbi:AAA family ATPase [Rugamonas aquatica]|uniref:AAA family ATPase n=1 Tax=Rugamonas aquatica TaxID=2743357 RepID=A0A6A7N6X2_9BURK|nr:AAA family ATPase [Rugamonas aquatica]MQA40681.1 AAA family ATPase [Rugamonas aquatica]